MATSRSRVDRVDLIACGRPRRKLDREPWLQLLTLVVSSATIGAIVARLLH